MSGTDTHAPEMSAEEMHAALSPIEDIIEDMRNGRMVVLVDAEDRENEGDLVIPAQMATPDAVNFMALFGRGLICLSLTRERADALDLNLMSPRNGTRHQTAFTVSIEAREGVSTGISAHDRARTIAVAIDPTKGPQDIVTPGHVFPLVARDGGVLVRAGHTEAAVDLARLAGLNPAGVICEIMNDDGTMARLPDLVAFSRRHGIRIGTIADLIAYRRRHDHLMARVRESEVTVPGLGQARMIVYANTVEYAEHVALVKGDIAKGGPVLVRMHASTVCDDLLGLGGATRGRMLHDALAEIGREGRGVCVILRDTRPDAVTAYLGRKETGASDQPRMLREYGVGAQILLDLGIREMELLTNSPAQSLVALDGYGLTVHGRRPIPAGS